MNNPGEIVPKKRLTVLDTTLRDGEQAPGLSLTPGEKLLVARHLARLGVDVIEAGFAYSGRGEFEALRAISSEIEGPVICSLARAREEDIYCAYRALYGAQRSRINIFHPTSDILLRHQLGIDRDEALKSCADMVKFARTLFDDVEFCPMDSTRTDRSYLYDVLEAAISAGARTVNIADTVGFSAPEEFGFLVRSLGDMVPGIEEVCISVHCHNDLGMALANTLAGIQNGADQVEVTLNGMGERAGNCSLAALVSVLAQRHDIYPVSTGIDAAQIPFIGRLLDTLWVNV